MSAATRSAPAVTYPLRRSRVLALLLAALAGTAGAVVGLWTCAGTGSEGMALATGWLLWVTATLAAAHLWAACPVGFLGWDRTQWTTAAPDRGGAPPCPLREAPIVHLDLQSALWVSVQPQQGGRRVWLWLERSACPPRWLDLRRAVYSRAHPAAPGGDPTVPPDRAGRES